MLNIDTGFFGREFWMEEGLHYVEPYFRLEKIANIVNSLGYGKTWDLLDIGCGPATLAKLIKGNISYYGIDIAIQEPAPNLIELDITKNPIGFRDMTFKIVTAAGVFEYLGDLYNQKFNEISAILEKSGIFITTYTNFEHLHHERMANDNYNNIMPVRDFRTNLEKFFSIDYWYPSSHNWLRSEPVRKWVKKIQIPMHFHVPLFSHLFAVNYIFICSMKIESY